MFMWRIVRLKWTNTYQPFESHTFVHTAEHAAFACSSASCCWACLLCVKCSLKTFLYLSSASILCCQCFFFFKKKGVRGEVKGHKAIGGLLRCHCCAGARQEWMLRCGGEGMCAGERERGREGEMKYPQQIPCSCLEVYKEAHKL